ncbi:MAG TPA: undecaprenyl-diphosphate phosphatase [Gammaproteobacteria bacterium]
MTWLDALILGLVEGLTEFLPISSTGHLILARSLLGLHGEAVDRMLIVIQGAAILAVCFEYRRRLWDTVRDLPREERARRFAVNLAVAFVPLAALGFLFEERIESLLFAPVPVAVALVVGGVLILWAERRRHSEKIATVDDMGAGQALAIGFFQALALVPGTSRSAATILGGLLIGMSRRAATEFSFFVAIPTLLGATVYKLWQAGDSLLVDELESLAIASAAAFVSALLSIRWLLRFVSRHSFEGFAWYRIAFGALILLTAALGWVAW